MCIRDRYHRTLTVGRVQTPTLAMLVDRDSRITLFRTQKYHHVRLALDGAEAVSEKITAPEEAESLRADVYKRQHLCLPGHHGPLAEGPRDAAHYQSV